MDNGMDIGAEQACFDEMRERLMADGHTGQYVLMKHGEVVGFYRTAIVAHDAGIEKFGLETVFLIGRVEPQRVHFVSAFWGTEPVIERR